MIERALGPQGSTQSQCPACESLITDIDARFCSQCGIRLDNALAIQHAEQATPGQRRLGGTTETLMRPLTTPVAASTPDSIDHTHDFVPVPGIEHLGTTPRALTRRRRIRRKRLYRRPIFIIPMVLLLVGLSAAGVLSYKLNATFNTVQTLSTPPPVIPGTRLGGGEGVQIDTAPAQAAVAASKRTTGAPDTGHANLGAADRSDAAIASSAGHDGGGGSASQIATAPVQSVPAAVSLRQAEPGTQNILLMGVDARPGEAIDIGVRPDVLAILHLNEKTGSCRMLSIPRDTRVNLPGYGLTKINHALAVGGIPYEQQVVQDYLGISIDHYGLIDFSGVTQLVDAVGGVVVVNPAAFAAGGFAFDEGTITLDGTRALAYARYRGGADGDFGRIGRQQQIIHAVMTKISGQNVLSLAPKLFGMLNANSKTDLGLGDILDLARTFSSTCTAETLETQTLAGSVATYPDPLLKMDLSYVIVDPAELQAKLAWLLADK